MNACMGSLYIFTLWSPGSLSSSALSYESTSMNYESWSDDDIHEEDDKNLRHDEHSDGHEGVFSMFMNCVISS